MTEAESPQLKNTDEVIERLFETIGWNLPADSRDSSLAVLRNTLDDAVESLQADYWGEEELPPFNRDSIKSDVERVYENIVVQSLRTERIRKLMSDVVASVNLGLPDSLERLFVRDCERVVSDTINSDPVRLRVLIQHLLSALGKVPLDSSARLDPRADATYWEGDPVLSQLDAKAAQYAVMFQLQEAYRFFYRVDQRIKRSNQEALQSDEQIDNELRSLMELILWRVKILTTSHTPSDQLKLSETIVRELEEVLEYANSRYAKRKDVVARLKYNLQKVIRQFFGDKYFSWLGK